MREVIESWKNKNGNQKFSNKDLLIYLVQKVNSIDSKLSSIYTTQSFHNKLIWSLYGALGGLLILTLKLMKIM